VISISHHIHSTRSCGFGAGRSVPGNWCWAGISPSLRFDLSCCATNWPTESRLCYYHLL